MRGLTTYHESTLCSAYLGANESWQKHLLDKHDSFVQLGGKTSLHPNSFDVMDVCTQQDCQTIWGFKDLSHGHGECYLLWIGVGVVTMQVWPVTAFFFIGISGVIPMRHICNPGNLASSSANGRAGFIT